MFVFFSFFNSGILRIHSHNEWRYRCVAKNPRGETDGTIKIYRELIDFLFFLPRSPSLNSPLLKLEMDREKEMGAESDAPWLTL